MKHIFRYIKGTLDYGITYKKENNKLQAYSDADWGSNLSDRRSYSGYIFILGGGAISWCSRKQKCVALNTVESEFVALTETIKEYIFLRNLLHEIKEDFVIDKEFTIFMDNQGAIKLASNQTTSDRSKHNCFLFVKR